MQEVSNKDTIDVFREFLKSFPKFYYVLVYTFGPAYLGYMNPKDFLKKHFPNQDKKVHILNLGSGPRRIREDVQNVDITSYKGVDIVASMTELPFETETVDGFICDNVLEHVHDPAKAAAEIERVLRVGGVGYVSTPFVYPFHASPYDYTRWTEQGLRKLFGSLEVVEMGSRSGIFSSLNVWLCYLLPSLFSFGSDKVYWLLVNLSLFLFFPVKFLDILANRLPFATRNASVLYCVVRKKEKNETAPATI